MDNTSTAPRSSQSQQRSHSVVTNATAVTAVTNVSRTSQARRSLRATSVLAQPNFNGKDTRTRIPIPYAIDAEAEGLENAVNSSDEDLGALELGKKYEAVFGDVELVIADLSGTMFEDLHEPVKPFPGAIEAFNLLKESGTRLVMVTNSWKYSKNSIIELLQSGGFDVDPNDVFTSTDACIQYLKDNNLKRPYYLVGEDVLKDFKEDFQKRHNEDVVIVGVASTQFDYRLLSKGMSLLTSGVPMIALNMMKLENTATTENVCLGAGPFISMLTYCTDNEPVTVCKPFPKFYEALSAKIGCPDYSKVVVIGDEMSEDIVGAKSIGMKAILTRTGRYQVSEEKTVCSGLTPDATSASFAMAVRTLLAAIAVSQMTEEDFVLEDKSSRGCGSDTSIPMEDLLAIKMQGYLKADYKSKRTETCTPAIKLPSLIW